MRERRARTSDRAGERSSRADLDPAVERLIEEARERQSAGLGDRERKVELLLAGGFLVAAVLAAALLPSQHAFAIGPALAAVVAYAIAARVRFHTGAGWTVPTELVFVPMLFVLPAPAVPLLVAAALAASRLPEYLRRTVRADRAVVAVGDAWYTIGPVLVLSLAGAATPAWGDWPIYLAALAAQFVADFAASAIQGRGLDLDIRLHLPELGLVYAVDALLAPIGLLAAFASAGQTYAFLLVLPLVGLVAIFAREREARIENALTLSHAYRGTAHLLGELLAASDEYTGGHSRSVVGLSHQVAKQMNLDEAGMREVEFGALLHDVGKMSVPKEILNKPGRLTDDEMTVMKRHVVEGQWMLQQIGGVLAEAGYIVRTHHERYDGGGYPDGLAGDQIPLAGRIIACCDAFNAMTTDRPYRDALPLEHALTELQTHSGTQFDPKVVAVLEEIISRSAIETAAPGSEVSLGGDAAQAISA